MQFHSDTNPALYLLLTTMYLADNEVDDFFKEPLDNIMQFVTKGGADTSWFEVLFPRHTFEWYSAISRGRFLAGSQR